MSARSERRADALGWTGARQATFSRTTGTLVVVVDGAEALVDVEGGRWSTICDDHGWIVAHTTLALARDHAVDPTGWCEFCMHRATRRQCASCSGMCRWADDAWVCTDCGDEWYPEHGGEYTPPSDG